MMRRGIRSGWFVPVAVLLFLFVLRGTACKKKPAPAPRAEITPASKGGVWITPLMTAAPPPPTPTLWRTDITRIPTLPE